MKIVHFFEEDKETSLDYDIRDMGKQFFKFSDMDIEKHQIYWKSL